MNTTPVKPPKLAVRPPKRRKKRRAPSWPFGEMASSYLGLGWNPVPCDGKHLAVSGYSGYDGAAVTDNELNEWVGEYMGHNVALVLPDGVIGIDVDHYGNKRGGDTLAAKETEWGGLPPTWVSTSRRDGVSRIRLYRVPAGTVLEGQAGKHVEIVQRHHRYVMVAPSVHPTTGRLYEWVNPDGKRTGQLPRPEELAELPEAWVAGLRKGAPQRLGGGLGPGDGVSLRAGLAPGEPDARVRALLGKAAAGLTGEHGSRYDAVRDDVARLLRAGEQGSVGVPGAIETLRRLYVLALGPSRGGEAVAGAEFDRHYASGADLIAGDPSAASGGAASVDGATEDDGAVQVKLHGLRVAARARELHQQEKAREQLAAATVHVVDGAEFLVEDSHPEPLWGEGDRVLWARGEGLMICGPQGVGKSTIAQKIMFARAGLTEPSLFGFPVEPDDRPILYLAMDRPPQISRSMRRMVDTSNAEVLADLRKHLRVHKGPPPFDAARVPGLFAEWVQTVGDSPGLVIVDSLKDLAAGLTTDEGGGGVNAAMQAVLADGTEFIDLHHQRKANADNPKPARLSDVYGSTWLTSGHGSVLLAWGSAGDETIELTHLKQPQEKVGPLIVNHSHADGASQVVDHGAALLGLALTAGADGITEARAVWALFGTDPDDEFYSNHKKSVRRRFDKLTNDGVVRHEPGKRGGLGGGGSAARWVVV